MVHNESTGDIDISGNVMVSDDKGNSLRTDRALWESDSSVMTCPGSVLLMSGDVTISGDSMVCDWGAGELEDCREGKGDVAVRGGAYSRQGSV